MSLNDIGVMKKCQIRMELAGVQYRSSFWIRIEILGVQQYNTTLEAYVLSYFKIANLHINGKLNATDCQTQIYVKVHQVGETVSSFSYINIFHPQLSSLLLSIKLKDQLVFLMINRSIRLLFVNSTVSLCCCSGQSFSDPNSYWGYYRSTWRFFLRHFRLQLGTDFCLFSGNLFSFSF